MSRTIVAEIERRIDQREMREGLWKIADQALRSRIVFLGQQADIVGQSQQAPEQRRRVIIASLQHHVVGKPEAAGEGHTLAGRQAVLGFLGLLAPNQSPMHQLALDRGDSAAHARISCWQAATGWPVCR